MVCRSAVSICQNHQSKSFAASWLRVGFDAGRQVDDAVVLEFSSEVFDLTVRFQGDRLALSKQIRIDREHVRSSPVGYDIRASYAVGGLEGEVDAD